MILWVLWMTYGSFYFCRTNISAAVPGMEADLGLSKIEIANILGSLKLAYGIGQFINGQLAERFRPRVLLAIGMMLSAVLNVVFGLGTGFYFLLFVWAMNGYSQSMGWTPCMKVASNWIPAGRRGRAIGIIGTGYQVTAALTFLISGWAAERFGWRGAFYVPAGLLFLSSLHMLFTLRESPDEANTSEPQGRSAPRLASGQIFRNVLTTLTNPGLWFLAVTLGLLNANRYGFLDWGISHLSEVIEDGVGTASVKYALLPLGGVAGALITGWATDRFLGGRRAPAIAFLLALLGLLTLSYNYVVHWGMLPTGALLVLIGFCIYGPQVLLVGTAPLDLARRGTPAAAVGFVNFMGYMGAYAGDRVTGQMVQEHGWNVAVKVWAGFAFAGAVAVCFLWNARPQDDRGREGGS